MEHLTQYFGLAGWGDNMSMLKAFAPILGEFSGRGARPDGSELICHFKGEEVIYDVCYTLRLEVYSADTTELLVNSMALITADSHGKIQLQYIDSHEHIGNMNWAQESAVASSDAHGRIFAFDGHKENGKACRLSIDVLSAEDFKIVFEMATSRDSHPQLSWEVSLGRQHSNVTKLRVA